MKRKMTFFALAGMCGKPIDSAPRTPALASSASKLANATEPKPLAKRRNICRRVRGADKKRPQCMNSTHGTKMNSFTFNNTWHKSVQTAGEFEVVLASERLATKS